MAQLGSIRMRSKPIAIAGARLLWECKRQRHSAERCAQAVISGCVYLVGDLIAQSYEGLTEGAVDTARAVRSGAVCMPTTLCNI